MLCAKGERLTLSCPHAASSTATRQSLGRRLPVTTVESMQNAVFGAFAQRVSYMPGIADLSAAVLMTTGAQARAASQTSRSRRHLLGMTAFASLRRNIFVNYQLFNSTGAQYCTTALLTYGTNQIYSFLACGTGALVEHYLNSPTAETTTIAESTSRPGTEVTKAAATKTSPTSLPAETSRSNSTTVTTSQSPSNSFAMATGSSSSQEQRSNDGTSNVSAIVGGAVGGIALVCASAIAIVYLVRRTRAVVPDRNDVPSELAGDTADSGCFNAAQEEVEPKALWMPSELSAVPVRRVELPG